MPCKLWSQQHRLLMFKARHNIKTLSLWLRESSAMSDALLEDLFSGGRNTAPDHSF